jgi:hypothetical protein
MTHNDANTVNASPLAVTPPVAGDSAPDAMADAAQTEDSVLALLQAPNLSPESIEKLGKSSLVTKSRKVKLAMVRHPKTPRYISLSLIRKLFTFDLMRVALTPTVVGDLKVAAEAVLINRLEKISAGEKLSLARRASGRVASVLLLDAELRIITAALQNPRLTEALVAKALLQQESSLALVQAVCVHHNWALRREIRIALLRNQHTLPEYAVEFAKSLPSDVVTEILQNSNLPETLKTRLNQETQP